MDQSMKLMRGAALIKKELRQNLAVLAFSSFSPLLCLGVLWFSPVAARYGPDVEIPYFEILYFIALLTAALLGSTFLAEENRSHATNLLLRLPVSRGRIFTFKILSHCALFLGGLLVATALFKSTALCPRLLGTLATGSWLAERPFLHLAILWLPITYLLAVCVSVTSESWLKTLLSALLGTVIVLVLSAQASQRIAGAIPRMIAEPRAFYRYRIPPEQLVLGILLACWVPILAALAWVLFSRKEGR